MNPINDKFECWAIVELFGHTKIAGKCTEQNIAGTNMLRVDVPAVEGRQAFTKFYGSAAIYALTPVDETTAKHFVSKLSVEPIMHWDINEIFQKQQSALGIAKPSPLEEQVENDGLDDDINDILPPIPVTIHDSVLREPSIDDLPF